MMAWKKQLRKEQIAVLEDLFNSDLDEQAVLDKHKVRRSTFDRWMDDKTFAERFKQYVNGLKRRRELLMAKYSCRAAEKLLKLTGSEREETARKACLDIISPPSRAAKKGQGSSEQQSRPDNQAEQLPLKTARKLLAVLAEEKSEG
ncbi:MAG: hypothetical protein ACYS0I_02615 [Planctomycetota bacterium]|jgi:hypothetical protein